MSLLAQLGSDKIEEIARQLGVDPEDIKAKGFTFLPLIMPVHLTNLEKNIAPYGGDIKDNFALVTLVTETVASRSVTVPPTKRWYLWGGLIHNADSVARLMEVVIYNESDQRVQVLMDALNALTGVLYSFPNTTATSKQAGSGSYPIPMKAGWYVKFSWSAGTAGAGGSAQTTAIISEVDE